MKDAIAKYQQPQPLSIGLPETVQLGQVFAASGFFQDSKDQAQAIVKILAGRELGLPPVASMTSIYVVKGRVTLSAQAMGAIILSSGEYSYRVRELSGTSCTIEFFRHGETLGLSSFSLEDARLAGLSSETWKKYPRNLLFARALSNGARWYCPHLIMGAYTPEEMGAPVDSEGEIVPPSPPKNNGQQKVHSPQKPEPQAANYNGDNGESDPETVPPDWKRIMAAVHASASEYGLDHDDLHHLLGVSSLKDADPDDLRDLPGTLRLWRATDEEAGVLGALAQFREDMESADSVSHLAGVWAEWADRRKVWSRLAKLQAAKIKEECKTSLTEPPAEEVTP